MLLTLYTCFICIKLDSNSDGKLLVHVCDRSYAIMDNLNSYELKPTNLHKFVG